MASILDRLIGRTVKTAVDDAVESHLKTDGFRQMVLRELRDAMPHFDFVKQIQARLQQVDPTMPDKRAYEYAEQLFWDLCRDENCQFGDPRFDWSAAAARTIADEEIAHWEPTDGE
jgi:hypothetical protein